MKKNLNFEMTIICKFGSKYTSQETKKKNSQGPFPGWFPIQFFIHQTQRIMKKTFTFFVAFFLLAAAGYAQKGGEIDLPRQLEGRVVLARDQSSPKETVILLPGLWEQVTQVGLYQWTNNSVPVGWIFGNNAYGAVGAGSKFTVEAPKEVVGAYFWFGSVAEGDEDIVIGIYGFADDAVGELIASVTVNLADITELVATGAEPGDYVDAFYVAFDTPVEVEGDFFMGFDASAVTYTAHGDGLGLVSSTQGGGGGASHGYILHINDGWEPATAWNAALVFDLAIFPVVPAEGFDVTFNVDMTAVEGFDPATHNVWLTGSMTGWAQPGTEGSVEMTRVTPKEAEVVFEEHFDGAIPDTWETVINDGPVGWAWTDVGGNYGGQLASTTADNGYAMLDSDGLGTGAAEDADLISPSLDMTNVGGEILLSLEHMARTYGLAECRIYVSADDFETSTMIYEWKDAAQNEFNTDDGTAPSPAVINSSFDISEFGGEPNVKIKFNWIGSYDYWWLIDDIEITGTLTGGGDEHIYTATVNVPGGEIQYKYFSDVIAAGWDGGEWAGDPNRVVTIDGDVVINNVWGDLVVGVDEMETDPAFRVFPNPVRETLNIRSESQIDYLRVFDLAGRMVFNADVMDFSTTIDVSPFNNGIYILQLISGRQVETLKIQVVK